MNEAEAARRESPMSWQRPSTALVLFGAVVALLVATGVAEFTAPADARSVRPQDIWWGASLAFPFPIVGYAIARRVPRNPLGWLFLIAPLMLVTSAFLSAMIGHWKVDSPALAVYASSVLFFGGAGLLAGFALVWFPTGRVPSRRWRWVIWLTAIGLGLFMLGMVSTDCVVWQVGTLAPGEPVPTVCGDPAGPAYAEFVGPIDLGTIGGQGVATIIVGIGFFAVVASLFVGIVSLVVRFRRSVGSERDQLRWPLVVVVVLGALIAVAVAIEATGGEGAFLGAVAMQVAAVGIPVSIGMAVTRFRLYDVDRVISRTVAYSIVALVLAALYVAVTLAPAVVLGSDAGTPPWVTALATLTAFVVFQPLRLRVQDVVDRRFNRARFDAQVVVEQFSDQVRDATDLEHVAGSLARVSGRVFQPQSIGVWMRSDA